MTKYSSFENKQSGMVVRNAVWTKEKAWGSVNKQSGWFLGYLRELRGTKHSSRTATSLHRSGAPSWGNAISFFFFLFYLVLGFVFTARGKNAHGCWNSRRGHSVCVASAEMRKRRGEGGGLLSLKKFVARPPCNDLSQSLERLQHLKAAIRHVGCSCCKYKHKDDSSIANTRTVAL